MLGSRRQSSPSVVWFTIASVGLGVTVAIVAPQAASATTNTLTFATRGCTAWTVPTGVSAITVSASGEAGSGSSPFAGGGAGDIVSGTLSGLPAGPNGGGTLNICVGVNGGQPGTSNGGFFSPAPGGGASGVALVGGALQSALIIAGGGGGGTNFRGGAAGLPVAGNGVGSQGGFGGNNGAPTGGAGGAGQPGYGAGSPGAGNSPFAVFAAGGQGGSGASGGGAGYHGGGGGGGGSTGGPGGGGTDYCDGSYVSSCAVQSGGSYQPGVSTDPANAHVTITYTAPATSVSVNVSGSQTYGSATPTFSYSASAPAGVVVGGAVTCDQLTSGPIAPVVPVGASDISAASCSGLSLSGPNSAGLSIVYSAAPGSFAVAPAPLTITAVASSPQVYGGPAASVSASYSGFVNGEGTAVLKAMPLCAGLPVSTPAGTYSMGANCSGATADNYSITYVPGVLIVDPAPLQVVPNDQSIPFGSADPEFTFDLVGLVPGDSLSTPPTCSVTGSHVKVGTYRIACSGAVAGSNYVLDETATATLTVTLAVSTTGIGTALIDQPYSGKLAAKGGTGTLTWTLAAGTLPAGLTLAKSGAITGSPSVAGTFPLTVRVTDGATPPNTVLAQVTIVVDPMTISTSSLPAGLVGKGYSTQLARSGGKGTNTWQLAAGSTLPPGLRLTTAGAITGIPQAPGTTSFTVMVTDSASPKNVATRQETIVIAAMTITTRSLKAATAKQYYSVTLTHSGGVGTLHYSVSSGSLPAGLRLSPAGALTGTPVAAGTFTFTVRLVDSAKPTQNVAYATYTLVVK